MFRASALVLAAGIAIQFAPSLPAALTIPELLGAGLALVWLLWGPLWLLGCATIAWSTLTFAWMLEDRLDPLLAGQDIVVVGTICDFPRHDGRSHRFMLCVDQPPTGVRLPQFLYLGSYGVLSEALAGGQQWRLRVRLKRPRGQSNPGGFDYERWAFARRIGATGYVRRSVRNQLVAASGSRGALIRIRQALAAQIEGVLGTTRPARFAVAIAVGARHRLTVDDWRLLRRTGTAHLMAISGLHIGLVAGLLFWLGRRSATLLLFMRIRCAPLPVARILALGGAAGYTALAGFAVPTTRALVMACVAILLTTARRSFSAWQILAAALLAVAWLDPFALLGPGFWLSFGAVAVLILAASALQTRAQPSSTLARRTVRQLRLLVGAQLVLCTGLMPLAILFFAEVSLVAPLANLFAVPLFAVLVVPLTLLGVVLLACAPAAGAPVLIAGAAVLEFILTSLDWLSTGNASMWRQAVPGNGWVAALVLGAVFMVWPRPVPLRWLGVLPVAALGVGLATPAAPDLRVIVMDVGQGLAVLVQTPGHALLYDAGPAFGSRDSGQTVVLPVLRQLGVTRLDTIVVSHGDNDHVGGAQTILNAYPNAKLVATESFGLRAGRFDTCTGGLHWTWGAARFEILYPTGAEAGFRAGENDLSCVLSVRTPTASILLPGDVEHFAETRLVANRNLGRHELVVAPHHGSATSSTARFISALGAAVVIFPTGYGNRWGFPDPAVRSRWRSGGACTLNTAVSGALVFEATRDHGLRLISRQRLDRRRLWMDGPDYDGPSALGDTTNYCGARL